MKTITFVGMIISLYYIGQIVDKLEKAPICYQVKQ
jgi:hypothetical protein